MRHYDRAECLKYDRKAHSKTHRHGGFGSRTDDGYGADQTRCLVSCSLTSWRWVPHAALGRAALG